MATDYAGNVQATPTSAQATTRVVSPLSVTSIAAISPAPRNTAVTSIDVTFSVPINTGSLTSGALTLTDDGGPNLINAGVSLSLVSGTTTTYAIGGLAGLTTAQGHVYAQRQCRRYPGLRMAIAGTGSLSTSWLMDTTAPTSHVVNALGTSQTSDTFPVSVDLQRPDRYRRRARLGRRVGRSVRLGQQRPLHPLPDPDPDGTPRHPAR